MSDLDSLTDSQREALAQLQSVTERSDVETQLGVLDSVDWDVQRAVDMIFDANESSQPGSSRTPQHMKNFEIDDSRQNEPRPAPNDSGSALIKLLALPFTVSINLFSSLFNFIFRILRIPFPSAFSSIWRPNPRRHRAQDPASVAERWVTQLEEETGAVRGGLMQVDAVSTGAEAGPGPSTLSRRNEESRDSIKQLPDFSIGSYESALRAAEKQRRILCAILVSEEHDDVLEFKRSTLTNPEFNQLLKTNNFIVWGGDVRDREAHQASQKLSVTTFPFVGFVALQPRPGARNSTASPSLTILSRHQGPSQPSSSTLPSSALGPTSATALCNHITNTLVPRVNPYLARLVATAKERERERQLREEQDAAFKLAASRDRERIEAKKEEERLRLLEERKAEEARSEVEAKRLKEAEEKLRRSQLRQDWLRYLRKSVVTPEPTSAPSVRVGVRLLDGQRIIRRFAPNDTLTSLYAFVAVQSISSQYPESSDPDIPPIGYSSTEDKMKVDDWGFKLVSSYPRVEVPWESQKPLSEIKALQGGAQLVVEAASSGDQIENVALDDNDEYDTEEE